ncbi:MAG TPA: hypothetical protein VGK73_02770 [Polyangiaceae bacterium]
MTRAGGTFAVLIGAVVGVSAALARRGDEPSPAPGAADAPAVARREEPAPEPVGPAANPTSEAPLNPVAATLASALLPAAGQPAATLRVPAPPAVASLDELKAIEIRCYDQDTVACRRAAAAYDAGGVVARDAARAENYRKVELTQLVRQCEKRLPLACLRLADRYDEGDGVARDARRAQKLADHAGELCSKRPVEGCPGR